MLLDEQSFCKLKNELNVIYFSNVAWKLVLMTFGSFVHSLVQNSEFLRHLWAIYEFSWFYLIYFWFLVLTHSYESLDGVHASFVIFGILFEQWSKFKVEIVKIGKILGCLKFGSADSPRVRGGRSAVHETCLPEALQKSFKPQNYTADGPPKNRGRSADHRFNLQASDTPMSCLLSNARTVRQGSADSPPMVSSGGSWQLDLSWATKVYL